MSPLHGTPNSGTSKTTQITKNQNINSKFSTKIDTIEVFGLSFENNLKISKDLNFLLFQNIFLCISKIRL